MKTLTKLQEGDKVVVVATGGFLKIGEHGVIVPNAAGYGSDIVTVELEDHFRCVTLPTNLEKV